MGGSIKGERRGGRRKGTPNRATPAMAVARTAAVHQALTGGETPLDVMTRVMRGEAGITDRQFAAACAAAPCVHARLSAAVVEHRDALTDLSLDQLLALTAAAERCVAADALAPPAGGEGEAEEGAVH